MYIRQYKQSETISSQKQTHTRVTYQGRMALLNVNAQNTIKYQKQLRTATVSIRAIKTVISLRF